MNKIDYQCFYVKDIKHLFSDIIQIANSYSKDFLTKELFFYSKIDARIVCAFEEKTLVGYYIYMPATKFLFNPKWSKLKIVLKEFEINIHKSTVPCYSFVNKKYDGLDIYYEMNKLRVFDAKNQGYTHGIIGLNLLRDDINGDICKERLFITQIEDFVNRTNTSYMIIPFKHDFGKEVYVQIY
jgi:hypothetical protein